MFQQTLLLHSHYLYIHIHEPIALLDGRNGDALRNWLKNNKHIKVVTRDRASA